MVVTLLRSPVVFGCPGTNGGEDEDQNEYNPYDGENYSRAIVNFVPEDRVFRVIDISEEEVKDFIDYSSDSVEPAIIAEVVADH